MLACAGFFSNQPRLVRRVEDVWINPTQPNIQHFSPEQCRVCVCIFKTRTPSARNREFLGNELHNPTPPTTPGLRNCLATEKQRVRRASRCAAPARSLALGRQYRTRTVATRVDRNPCRPAPTTVVSPSVFRQRVFVTHFSGREFRNGNFS